MTSAAPTTFPTSQQYPGARRYADATGVQPNRGSVVILTGRAETASSFERLRTRLSIDGYLVTISGGPGDTVSTLAEARVPGAPFILLGSDVGGLRALVLAGSPALRPDGVVLLGLPLLQRPVTSGESGVLAEDAEISVYPVPRALPDLPILLVHGMDDQVCPLPLIRMITHTAPRAQLTVVPGRHDIIAGPGYRAVAASTLLFLESLQNRESPRNDESLGRGQFLHENPGKRYM